MKNLIEITIGDWSKDGHNQSDKYLFDCNKTVKEVREAYFKAKERYPNLCPEIPCSEYEEACIRENYIEAVKAAGCTVLGDLKVEEGEDGAYVNSETFAYLVAWFITLGDPKIKLKRLVAQSIHFVGYDKKKRHIGQFGYGLFY